MALINCPECGVQFSEFASACPKCGYPNKKDSSPADTIPPKEPVSVISKKSNKKQYFRVSGFGMLIVIVILATLPFHYIPSRSLVFPKDHLTFTNTFITESDIEDIINRFNQIATFQIFDIRGKKEFPSVDKFDIYISTGGPGNPLEGDGNWDLMWYDFINQLTEWNKEQKIKKQWL